MFQGRAYQFTCLPFRLCSAPWVFTKTLKPAIAMRQQEGVRLIACMDDILLLVESREMIHNHLTGGDILIRKSGVYNQQKEICYEPSSNLRIPRSNSGLNGATPSPTKKENCMGGSAQNSKAGNYDSLFLGLLVRHDECDKLRHSPSPIVLSPPTDDAIQHPRVELAVLQSVGYPSPGLPGRVLARMVGHQHGQVEWQDHLEEGDGPHHRLGTHPYRGWGASCNYQGTGGAWSDLERRMHINYLELLAAILATQTFVVKSRTGISEDRQYHSSGLHQPPWRNSL